MRLKIHYFVIFGFFLMTWVNTYSQKRIAVKQLKVDSTMIWQGDTIDFNTYLTSANIDSVINVCDTLGFRVDSLWDAIDTTFLQLYDTPSSYSGQGGKVAIVNTGETALEFGDITNLWTASYGELYIGSVQNFELSSYPDIDTTISTWTIGDTTYCKASTTGYLLPRASGTYIVRYSVSLDPQSADTARVGVWVNTTEKTESMSRGLMPANGSSLSGTNIIELTTTDTLRLKMRSYVGVRYEVLYGNMNIQKVK